MEGISLWMKEICNSFRKDFSSSIPPGLVTAESFIFLHILNGATPPDQQWYTNGRVHHEIQDWKNKAPSSQVPWYSMRKLFPFSLGEAIKLLLMLHLSVLGYETFVCFRCHGSWKMFLGNNTITLKPYLKENICDLARSLSWLHFNLNRRFLSQRIC